MAHVYHERRPCAARVRFAMKKPASRPSSRENREQEFRLHESISSLMREFRLAPGLLAGGPYAGLHANDIELFEILSQPVSWTVRAVAHALGAPISTISSALDRLEHAGLIRRTRSAADRRRVLVEPTSRGKKLAARLHDAHLANCRNMLLRLHPDERRQFVEFAAKIARLS